MNKLLVAAHWALLLIITASTIWLLGSGYQLWQQAQINDFIADPAAYETIPDDPRAHFAKAQQLEMQEEHELALEQLTLVLGYAGNPLMADAYFNRGNINLRKALTMTKSDARHIPLIELAKQDYRSALLLQPSMWDARYNLEVALRVVSEDPDIDGNFEKNVISSQRSIESKAFKVDLP
ncbi:MAG TPA: MxaK protein [Methylophaga sp.]|nr:MxaK protein [Methylophaga sp.]